MMDRCMSRTRSNLRELCAVRRSVRAALAMLALCVATSAAAQDPAAFYRGKTVRIVVGFSAGGGYDIYARVLAKHFARHIPGQPTVIVQNVPGAASLKSVQLLSAGAPTDGTLITTFNPGLITQSVTAPEKIRSEEHTSELQSLRP